MIKLKVIDINESITIISISDNLRVSNRIGSINSRGFGKSQGFGKKIQARKKVSVRAKNDDNLGLRLEKDEDRDKLVETLKKLVGICDKKVQVRARRKAIGYSLKIQST